MFKMDMVVIVCSKNFFRNTIQHEQNRAFVSFCFYFRYKSKWSKMIFTSFFLEKTMLISGKRSHQEDAGFIQLHYRRHIFCARSTLYSLNIN